MLHDMQVDDTVAPIDVEYFPSWHSVHFDAPEAEKDPAEHETQTDARLAPTPLTYLPAAHAVQEAVVESE